MYTMKFISIRRARLLIFEANRRKATNFRSNYAEGIYFIINIIYTTYNKLRKLVIINYLVKIIKNPVTRKNQVPGFEVGFFLPQIRFSPAGFFPDWKPYMCQMIVRVTLRVEHATYFFNLHMFTC